MIKRSFAVLVSAAFFGLQCVPSPAFAENQMGYRELSVQQAQQLPRLGGALGMDVGPAQHIDDGGMSFELLRVNGVHRGAAGAQAGFKVGDQIIAVDGRVFASVAAFAAYIGSLQPGQQISVDTIPAGGGPQQAQRIAVTVGGGSQAAAVQQSGPARPTGLSTGAKVAIGVGAAALFGCYKLGCFSHKTPQPAPVQQQ